MSPTRSPLTHPGGANRNSDLEQSDLPEKDLGENFYMVLHVMGVDRGVVDAAFAACVLCLHGMPYQ